MRRLPGRLVAPLALLRGACGRAPNPACSGGAAAGAASGAAVGALAGPPGIPVAGSSAVRPAPPPVRSPTPRDSSRPDAGATSVTHGSGGAGDVGLQAVHLVLLLHDPRLHHIADTDQSDE